MKVRRIDALQDGGAKGWGYVMVIPYGETRTVTLTYTLPETLSESAYTIALPAIADMNSVWDISLQPSRQHLQYNTLLRIFSRINDEATR